MKSQKINWDEIDLEMEQQKYMDGFPNIFDDFYKAHTTFWERNYPWFVIPAIIAIMLIISNF